MFTWRFGKAQMYIYWTSMLIHHVCLVFNSLVWKLPGENVSIWSQKVNVFFRFRFGKTIISKSSSGVYMCIPRCQICKTRQFYALKNVKPILFFIVPEYLGWGCFCYLFIGLPWRWGKSLKYNRLADILIREYKMLFRVKHEAITFSHLFYSMSKWTTNLPKLQYILLRLQESGWVGEILFNIQAQFTASYSRFYYYWLLSKTLFLVLSMYTGVFQLIHFSILNIKGPWSAGITVYFVCTQKPFSVCIDTNTCW